MKIKDMSNIELKNDMVYMSKVFINDSCMSG